MRTNHFGEKYCHTAEEARQVIEDSENGWEVYAAAFSEPQDDDKATCEIATNDDGDLVCYIEAPTLDKVREIVIELKLEGT